MNLVKINAKFWSWTYCVFFVQFADDQARNSCATHKILPTVGGSSSFEKVSIWSWASNIHIMYWPLCSLYCSMLGVEEELLNYLWMLMISGPKIFLPLVQNRLAYLAKGTYSEVFGYVEREFRVDTGYTPRFFMDCFNLLERSILVKTLIIVLVKT